MGGIGKGKAPLHTGVALIGLAILMGRHANHGIALHLSLEGTAHTTVCTGCYHFMLGLAQFNNTVFGEGRGRTGIDTGTA